MTHRVRHQLGHQGAALPRPSPAPERDWRPAEGPQRGPGHLPPLRLATKQNGAIGQGGKRPWRSAHDGAIGRVQPQRLCRTRIRLQGPGSNGLGLQRPDSSSLRLLRPSSSSLRGHRCPCRSAGLLRRRPSWRRAHHLGSLGKLARRRRVCDRARLRRGLLGLLRLGRPWRMLSLFPHSLKASTGKRATPHQHDAQHATIHPGPDRWALLRQSCRAFRTSAWKAGPFGPSLSFISFNIAWNGLCPSCGQGQTTHYQCPRC